MSARTLSWVVFLSSLLCGCAATAPYTVSLRKVAPDTSWLGDGPDVVLTVHNNTDSRRTLVVECAGTPQEWVVTVDPRGEASAIGQLMSVYTRSESCRVSEVLP